MNTRNLLTRAAFAAAAVLSFSGTGGDAVAEPPRAPPPNVPPVAPPSPTAGRWVALEIESPNPSPSFSFARTNGVWTARIAGLTHVQMRVRGKAGDPIRVAQPWAYKTVTFMLPQARDEQPTMIQMMGCFAADENYTTGGRLHEPGPPKIGAPGVFWQNMVYLFEGLAEGDVKVTSNEIEVRLNHPNLTTTACGHWVPLP